MSIELILYLILFVVLAVINVVGRWLRSNVEQEEGPAGELEESGILQQEGQEAWSIAGEEVTETSLERPTKISLADLSPQKRTRYRRWNRPVGNLNEARRGMVMMTILGPCKGLDRGNRDSSF
jgi:hypothetical protein